MQPDRVIKYIFSFYNSRPPFKTSVSERGTTKIKDYGANPCYSAWSEIGGMKRDTTLPDLLHVDYTPVELHSSMDIKTIESKFIA